jgi:hypothetical protein
MLRWQRILWKTGALSLVLLIASVGGVALEGVAA